MISPTSRSAIVCSRRWRVKFTSHRSASVVPRAGRSSTGTWYVAPPTRRLLTSSWLGEGGRMTPGMGPGWRITSLHHVAFAHGGEGPEGALTERLGLRCSHEEEGEGFLERMFPVGAAY